MTEVKKPSYIDWERIEIEYRAGLLSIREIADAHGISDTAIRKYAKGSKTRLPWERDLNAKIQSKADAMVRAELVRSTVRAETATEREVVEASAIAIAEVRNTHRSDIRRNRSLTMRLLEELEQTTDNRELFEQLGEILAAPDDKGTDKLNDIYRKVISLPSRIDSMKKLAETLKTVIALERETYGIDDGKTKTAGDALDKFLSSLDGGSASLLPN